MPLFHKSKDKLSKIKEYKIPKESEIQKITENNLQTIFGLDFVVSEFSVGNYRVDTLAFDNERQSFVIIEYKKVKSFSVIDQGFAYLSVMMANKADFILEYNENKESNLKRRQIDWGQSRVLFIAPKFSKYQLSAISFKDLPFELWEVKLYENDVVLYNRLESPESSESIEILTSKSPEIKNVTNEITTYSEEKHLDFLPVSLQEKYVELRDEVLNTFTDVEIKPLKHYLAYKANSNFLSVVFRRSAIKVFLGLSKGELDDPQNLSRDVAGKGHLGSGDYELTITEETKLNTIWDLIDQAYNKNR